MTADVERPVICTKCGATSGNDWKQCGGSCPLPDSPHYKAPADKVELLLPLPPARLVIKHDRGPISETEPFWNRRDVSDYARANVAHAADALNAEIEALKAEAQQQKEWLAWWGKFASLQTTRAERLAEALREARAHAAYLDSGEIVLQLDGREWMAKAQQVLDALLNPAAAQENDDA